MAGFRQQAPALCLARGQRAIKGSDGSSSAQNEMQDQRNYSENQQQVDQPASRVKKGEAANPSNQKNQEQYCPDTHLASFPVAENVPPASC